MTVSSFFSVSLSPPLIAVSLDQRALTLGWIVRSGHFAVNVLSETQSPLSDRFAARDNEPTRFDGVRLAHVEGAHSPLIEGAVVHLDCALQATFEAGDHILCLGRVGIALSHPGAPLIHQGGRYRSLGPLAGSAQPVDEDTRADRERSG